MEQLISFAGFRILLTTGEVQSQIQWLDAYDAAAVVISIDSRGAVILKGERQEEPE